ncbi:C4-dicarboxylate transporter DcuC [Gemmata sp. G18]|uniref:C4-dicarboxylate transporter DcuC n=2 Tax=Gemmata palustris TaxID=2822762 RepID=A0ABS5C3I8_9BACT|nr:C4-dicarboxylate transporter DcuC [Gemmata palustris]
MSVWWERKEPPPPSPLPEGKGETEPNPLTPFPKKEGGENSKAQAIAPQAPVLSLSPFGGGVKEGLPTQPEPINLLKALVPLVPLALLFASAMPAPYNLFEIPDSWVVLKKPDGSRDPAYNSRLIGFAMLIGVLVAAAVTPNKARDCVKEFFSGAGYGFANIVSLIVIANCFGEAIKSAGLAEALGALIRSAPGLMQPLAALVPLVFAAICGSGMASTQSLYGFFHGPAEALGLDPVAVGAMVSLGSAAGRTMSPVAAVVLMCGTLTGTNPFTLAKRVAVPLLVGITVVVLLRLAGAL